MIEIPRSLARRLSAVLRSSIRKPFFPHVPLVDFRADAQGLCVRVAQGEVAVEYRQPGSFRRATATLPLDALAAVEGPNESPVILEAGDAGQAVARWVDGGIPQVVAVEVPENAKRPKFPDSPGRFTSNPSALLTALAEAARSAADAETRYAMHRLLLRGKQGDVVGADSKELYVHASFAFGWTEDVLVPQMAAFGRPELGTVEAAEVGKTDQHVAVRFGAWTVFLGIDIRGRYPAVDMVIPRPSAGTLSAGSHLSTPSSCFAACPACPERLITTNLSLWNSTVMSPSGPGPPASLGPLNSSWPGARPPAPPPG